MLLVYYYARLIFFIYTFEFDCYRTVLVTSVVSTNNRLNVKSTHLILPVGTICRDSTVDNCIQCKAGACNTIHRCDSVTNGAI